MIGPGPIEEYNMVLDSLWISVSDWMGCASIGGRNKSRPMNTRHKRQAIPLHTRRNDFIYYKPDCVIEATVKDQRRPSGRVF